MAIGKNEQTWVRWLNSDGSLRYIITSNKDRSLYYLYDANLQKIGKANNPAELEKKYIKEA